MSMPSWRVRRASREGVEIAVLAHVQGVYAVTAERFGEFRGAWRQLLALIGKGQLGAFAVHRAGKRQRRWNARWQSQ